MDDALWIDVHELVRLLSARRGSFAYGRRKFAVVCAERLRMAAFDAVETQRLPTLARPAMRC